MNHNVTDVAIMLLIKGFVVDDRINVCICHLDIMKDAIKNSNHKYT